MSNIRALPEGDAIAAHIIELFDIVAPGHIPPPRPYWADQSQPRPVHDDQLLAEHHVATLALVRQASGLPPTLTDALLKLCDAWPDPAEAERWRKVIAVEDYMSARDELARRGGAA